MASNKIVADNKPPRAGKGRPKGAKNKTTRIAKEAIELAADKLGGVDRMVEWAKRDEQNERVFWGQIYTKLLPLQVNADIKADITAVAHRVIDGRATD